MTPGGDAGVHDSSAGRDIVAVSGGTLVINNAGRASELELEPATFLIRSKTPSPALLLNARFGALPYDDAGGHLEALMSWAMADMPFAVRVVAGRGGSGKTRAAVELCSELQRQGWTTGFLRRFSAAAPGAVANDRRRPHLIVLDYAEARTQELHTVLPDLSRAATPAQPIRVLLLMRQSGLALGDQGYLDVLRVGGAVMTDIAQDTSMQRLDHDARSVDTRAILESAVRRFALHLGVEAPQPDKALPAPETPLLAVAEAYLLLTSSTGDVARSEHELIDGLLARESAYWAATANEHSIERRLQGRIVALMTLATSEDEQQACTLLSNLAELRETTSERTHELARWASDLYPGPLYWNPLEPDLLGERLVAQSFDDRAELLDIVGSARRERVIAVLSRANLEEAPAAAEILGGMVRGLRDFERVQLSWTLEDEADPTRLGELLLQSTPTDDGLNELVLMNVASLRAAAPSLRRQALDGLLPLTVSGYPWRPKDWRDGQAVWEGTSLGQMILRFLVDAREEAISMLVSWSGRHEELEDLDGTDAAAVAGAVLLSQSDLLVAAAEGIAERDLEQLLDLVPTAARLHPRAIADTIEAWAGSNDPGMRLAAVSACSTLLDSASLEDGHVRVLRELSQVAWAGRPGALRVLARAAPGDEAIFREAAQQVLARKLDLTSLAPFADTQPLMLAAFLEELPPDLLGEALSSAIHLPDALTAPDTTIGRSGSEELEHALAGVVARAIDDANLRLKVALLAENSLYALSRGEDLPDWRIDAADILLQRTATDGRLSYLERALACRPGPPTYERARSRLLTTARGLPTRIEVFVNIVNGALFHKQHDSWDSDAPDWSVADLAMTCLAGLEPEDASQVVQGLSSATGLHEDALSLASDLAARLGVDLSSNQTADPD